VQRQLDAAGKEQTRPNSHAGMPSLFAEGIDNDTELLPHLEKRGREFAEGARLSLAKRAEQEATAMRTIPEEQKTRVAETATKYKDPQLLLDFDDDDEQRQLESDKRHWDKRLHAIDQELVTEPVRIRSIYEVKAQRIEPIGLVYLWPVTG